MGQRAEILIQEDGTKLYKRTCPRCRKVFTSSTQTQIYCSEQCKLAYNKARKSKAKSGKRYTKKHSVSRAIEAAARNLSRRVAMLVLKPVDMLTGEELQSWDLAQVHHCDLNCLNADISNLAILTAQSHAALHKEIKDTFGKDIEDKLYIFARADFNFESSEKYEEFKQLRDQVVKFQKDKFKIQYGQEIPEFNEKV